uniref:Si:ch211-216p19.6 n=1 Tax=Cyprinus carpio TaxID=7962 RepID=A0A8C1IY53_CYPCA
MASSTGSQAEQCMCSICQDFFTDPVTIPCGHNFCMACISQHWDSSMKTQCPLCKKNFHLRPDLGINREFRELVEGLKRGESPFHYCPQSQFGTRQAEVKLTIQSRMKKIEEIKHSVQLAKVSQKADIVELFTNLIRSLERCRDELLEVMEQKQKAAETQAEEFIKELEQDISELKRRNTELEQFNMTNITKRKVDERAMYYRCIVYSILHICLKSLLITSLSVNVTMDPETAHPKLFLSENDKQARYGETRQIVPDSPWRFDTCPSVLGKEGFSSGKLYFEVQVKGKTEWDLGVARESVNRKGIITLSPRNGLWTLWLRNGSEYKACDCLSVSLCLKVKPQKVGVYVDYEQGLVSFYDVESRSHIYSFTGQSFTEKLYPYFSPGFIYGDKNLAPLIISPVGKNNHIKRK